MTSKYTVEQVKNALKRAGVYVGYSPDVNGQVIDVTNATCLGIKTLGKIDFLADKIENVWVTGFIQRKRQQQKTYGLTDIYNF